jgi:prepilin-type N-terminal cleavage/methylation domain-containing protein
MSVQPSWWNIQRKPADGKYRMRRQRGFSLVELLIVVAIILIICAIAIPNMFRAKINANESSAVGSLRAIGTGEVTYAASYPTVGFSLNLASLGGSSCTSPSSTAACIIDNTLATATSTSASKSGYYFTYAPNSTIGYTANADPAYWNQSGTKHFYTDATAVIHFNSANQIASASDPTIQ